jgi:3-isopropylmalate/(R)-2-methylmalate dehydratase large subunit
MITYGTNPGMGLGIPVRFRMLEEVDETSKTSFMKSLSYMGFSPGEEMIGKRS